MRKQNGLILAMLFLASAALYAVDKKSDDHHHDAGPNGGELKDVGDKKGHHVELKHDQKNGKLSIWMLAGDAKTAVALSVKEAPKINLKTKDGNKQLAMKPVNEKDGSASQWESTDEVLKQDPLDGRIQFRLADDKKYNLDLNHKH